jgi:hypothetical protein
MYTFISKLKKSLFIITCILFFAVNMFTANAQTNTPLRRPVSPDQPMYLVHIDTWNYADPQKIIDLIPHDIRPYVVMNISLSISHNVETSQFHVAEYGYEIAKSWLRTCAQNQMWAVVQLASGGYAQFSDFDLSVYHEFYSEYPNLIGFNYAEQFWGYDDPNDRLSPKWTDRINHFANMLELSNRYGGYLIVSWCGNQWSPPINPIGMLKRIPAFAAASEKYAGNYMLFEKYTQQSYQSDMESICLGAYLSGYSGNYGIRYDDTGWTDNSGNHANFTMATAGAVHLEHIMLTGQTMIDGPELIWTQCFRETNRKTSTNGYSMRDWETFPQFINTTVDYFRKIIDGTVRIPTRQEVIDRTKYVVINDVNTGNSDVIYSTPETLFEGLYRMDGDGNLRNNKSFFKKTGRYPTIPVVYNLNDGPANSFQYQINRSDYASRWPNIASKVNEFNNEFPQEYTGNLYAGRHENGWVIYNPYKINQVASASIPFKYNTSERIEMTFSQYAAAVMKEYADSLTIYLGNHDVQLNTALKTNEIKVFGSTVEPTFTITDRGDHRGSTVTSNWENGVFTLSVRHNGPLDITINCSGTASNRLTEYTKATIIEPIKPPVYTGPRQYEAECFDYKNISGITTGGQHQPIRNYTGQGYLRVGTSSLAAVRDTVYALRTGTYQLITRYSSSGGDVSSLDLYVNGSKVATPVFTKTASDSHWDYVYETIELNTGKNVVEFIASRTAPHSMVLDNIVITQGSKNSVYHFENDPATTGATNPPAYLMTMQSGTAGVVAYTNNEGVESNTFKAYSLGEVNGTGIVDLDMFNTIARNYSVMWKEHYATTGASKGLLLRASGDHGSCPYAVGMQQGYLFVALNNEDNTVTLKTYIAGTDGITEKTAYTTSFKVLPGEPCWFRAKAFNDQLIFECSQDTINWEGGTETIYADNTYPIGATQLVWGMGTDNLDWVMDNISYFSENIKVSRFSIDRFNYSQGTGPSASQSFNVTGSSLSSNIEINSTESFEVSTHPTDGFSSSLILVQEGGNVEATDIYVRLKASLPVEAFGGSVSVSSGGVVIQTIALTGEVTPQPAIEIYDFTNDVATTSASTPPALYTAVGNGNTATAGVVSFTDANSGVASNMLKPYTNGQRNATGVVNLDLFPKNATDYSVSWKQYIGSAGTEYKVGVLLRGDTEKFGTATTGYVQGIMHGYLFIVYNTGSASQFRIYRSTSTFNELLMIVNTGVGTLNPAPGQPIWYRASATGSASVSLVFEYSTDGVNWNIGANTTDNTSPAFTSGATQIVWGLAANAVNFYMDDITFYGASEDSGTLPEVINVSERFLSGFNYMQGFGPSEPRSFNVSGDSLNDHILVKSTGAYEVSLNIEQGFGESVTIPNVDGKAVGTPVYVRLKSGLSNGSYPGELLISSRGVANRLVTLSGTVVPGPEIVVSTTGLSGFVYLNGFGPSGNLSFLVSGNLLFDDITLTSPEHYELTLTSGSAYSSALTIPQSDGGVPSTRVFVRLKTGLEAGNYENEIVITSNGATNQAVSLSGTVRQRTGSSFIPDNGAKVVSTQYYTITGQRVNSIEHLTGIFIEEKRMSDGSVSVSKIIKQE